jgi:hypothetical protein
MPEENRVFDVTRPGHSNPDTTSKPIIVGHRPTLSDPMVTDSHDPAGSYVEAAPTQITVKDEPHDQPPPEADSQKSATPEPDTSSSWITSPAFGADSPAEPAVPELGQLSPEPEVPPAEPATEPETNSEIFPTDTPPENQAPITDRPAEETPIEPVGDTEGLHVSEPKPKRRLGLVALVLLLLLAGAYAAIDSGLIKTSINLPFHIFKQKAAPAPASTQPKSQPAATTLPAGFTQYKLAGTSLSFAAPASWGAPTSAPDPGYSTRSTTAKSDGTYAYLVSFATNKDVQLAVTSSKYLPPARGSFYYDYLQWCTGTSDGKIYKTILHFSTTDKVDTPTTATCDQGPLTDATKLDATTIVQLNTKDAGGAALGDLYTKNLANADLPVLRVKDSARTNGSDIEQLLNTVKIPASSATSSSASQ